MTNGEGASKPPRVLFVARTVAHLSYFESVIAALIARGAQVELALDRQWTAKWPAGLAALEAFKAAHPTLATSWIVRRADEHRETIFGLREVRSYRSYLVRQRTTPFYVDRWLKTMPRSYRKQASREGGLDRMRTPDFEKDLVTWESETPPDPTICEFIRARSPDVLVASPTNLRYSEETDYIKAAHALGISTAIPVLSWDNLSTKGLIQILPTRLFVWNEDQKADALEFHGADPARVTVSGAPFFDKWFAPEADPISREAFCAMARLDPARPILLYLGSSNAIARDESGFVAQVRDALAADSVVSRWQVLLRPHPANAAVFEPLAEAGLAVWPRNGALPETPEAFAQMRASFASAAAVVGINTSGMIDAVLADRPTFSVRLPEYNETQTDTPHFQYLVRTGGVDLCADMAAFVGRLTSILGGEDPTAVARHRFIETFARPQGRERSAGDVVAEGVLRLAAGK